MKEFKSECDECCRHRPSRLFYKQIKDKWMYLCSDCWEKYDGTKKRIES